MSGEIKYRPQGDVLAAFGRSGKAVQIIRGPLGSGKTTGVVFKILKLISEQTPENGVRKSRIAAIRNTYPDLKRTTMREFGVFPPSIGKLKQGHAPTFDFNFQLADGTKVEATVDFVALDRPDDVKKLRGSQYTFAWLNETKELPKAILDMIMGRIDRYPRPGFSKYVGAIGDTNAWDEDHWLAELEDQFLMGQLDDYEFFTQPGGVMQVDSDHPDAAVSQNGTYWAVNPNAENLAVLRSDYYHRQIQGKKDDWIKVNLANEIGLSLDGKPVHPEYQETVHRSKKILLPEPNTLVYVGCDFGLQPAAAFAQKLPTGRWVILEEIVFEDGDAAQLADAIKFRVAEMRASIGLAPDDSESLKFVFRGDPAGGGRSQADSSTAFSIMRMNGVPTLPASSNDPSLRRGALTRPLTRMVNGGPGIVFSPRCRVLRAGLAGKFHYRRVQVAGDERFKNEPEKNYWSHIVEACEYALMDAGEHAVVNASSANRLFPDKPVTPHAPPENGGNTWSVFDV